MSSFSSTRANQGSESPRPPLANGNANGPLGLGAPRFGMSQPAPSVSGSGSGPLFHIKMYNYGPTNFYVSNPDVPDVIVNGKRMHPGPAPAMGQQGGGQGRAPVAPGTPRPAPGSPGVRNSFDDSLVRLRGYKL